MNFASFIDSLPRFFRRQKVIQLGLFFRPVWRTQEVRFNGDARVMVDFADPNARAYFIHHSFEPEFFEIAMPFLSAGGRMFDVGANFGFCGFGAVAGLPDHKLELHLFEANANLCGYLRESARFYPETTIKVNHCCVSDHDGESRLAISRSDLGQSFISAEAGEIVGNLILDRYIEKNGIDRIAFTKIDIEGYEPHALRGAVNALRAGILEVIYLEVSEPLLKRSGFTTRDCLTLLTQAGYSLYFCKDKDLSSAALKGREPQFLKVAGSRIPIAKVDSLDFPEGFASDILAVHRNCRLR